MSSWTIKISKTIKCYLVGLQNLHLNSQHGTISQKIATLKVRRYEYDPPVLVLIDYYSQYFVSWMRLHIPVHFISYIYLFILVIWNDCHSDMTPVMKSVSWDYISCFITVSLFYKCIPYSVILFLSVTISVLTLYLTSSISYRYLPCMDLMNA
jgi:uncharacterized membrane protein